MRTKIMRTVVVRSAVRTGAVAAAAVLVSVAFAATVWAEPLGLPVRLAAMPSGHLVISDHSQNRVVEWDPAKVKVVREFPVIGRPTGIACAWGKVIVGNEISRSVEVYSRSGRLQYVLGEPGQVAYPNDIAVDTDAGLVFVMDTAARQVVVFDFAAGRQLRRLPAPGAEPLFRPSAVAVDTLRRQVFVSDFGELKSFGSAPRIRIYDYDGNDVGEISGNRTAEYRFSAPQGLTINQQGMVYLVDSFRGEVLVFDPFTNQGVAIIGEVGRGPGQLMFPLDVEIDAKTNNVYVTNHRLGRVEAFIGMGLLP